MQPFVVTMLLAMGMIEWRDTPHKVKFRVIHRSKSKS